eukprot:8376278-Pyramimonas_sp.AAC.1
MRTNSLHGRGCVCHGRRGGRSGDAGPRAMGTRVRANICLRALPPKRAAPEAPNLAPLFWGAAGLAH